MPPPILSAVPTDPPVTRAELIAVARSVPARAHPVYWSIRARTDPDLRVRVAQAELARDLGTSLRSVARAVEDLVTGGVLRVESHRVSGRANIYRVVPPLAPDVPARPARTEPDAEPDAEPERPPLRVSGRATSENVCYVKSVTTRVSGQKRPIGPACRDISVRTHQEERTPARPRVYPSYPSLVSGHQKQQQGGSSAAAAGPSGPGAPSPEPRAPSPAGSPTHDALILAGVGEPVASRLARTALTPERVRRVAERVRGAGKPVGVLVRELETESARIDAERRRADADRQRRAADAAAVVHALGPDLAERYARSLIASWPPATRERAAGVLARGGLAAFFAGVRLAPDVIVNQARAWAESDHAPLETRP
jgi:hypothetical protein